MKIITLHEEDSLQLIGGSPETGTNILEDLVYTIFYRLAKAIKASNQSYIRTTYEEAMLYGGACGLID